jgi:hypothetical protein
MPPGEDRSDARPDRLTERRLELVAAVLLTLATVATAWAAYQARQWTGEQSQSYSVGTAARIAENRAAALANRQVQIDVATFIQWIDARQRNRPGLESFYRARFRPEFKPAFASWRALRPFESKAAPATPFDMPQYRLSASAEADRLERAAAAASERAREANQNADNYMLAVVLFALSLFFAGISSKFQALRVRSALLALGCVVFGATLIGIATLPVQLTT